MENNTISFTQHVLKKDLEVYANALFKQTVALQIENEGLKEKLAHLEELLKGMESIPVIGSKL